MIEEKPKTIFDLSQLSLATKDAKKPMNIWADELEALLPRNFLAVIPFEQLAQMPRYLKFHIAAPGAETGGARGIFCAEAEGASGAKTHTESTRDVTNFIEISPLTRIQTMLFLAP